ncbi:MAG: hypothetical protein IJX09_03695 [Clostridia bacterium]|nr:hypothetical protein [Clostridia bacterium]
METNKIQTYLGFCIRARKIIFGVEMIERQKKGVKLLMADGAIGKNSLKPTVQAHEKFGCPLIMTDGGMLGELLHRPAVKAIAITDESLAAAIVAEAKKQSEFTFYSGGNN